MKKILFLLCLLPITCFSQVKFDISKGRRYVEVKSNNISKRLYCLGITKDSVSKDDRYIYLSWSLTDSTSANTLLVGSVTMDVSEVSSALEKMNVNQTVHMFNYIIKNDNNLKDITIK